MPEKKKTNKKQVKAPKRDLKPKKNPKGGLFRFARSRQQDYARRIW